MNIEEAIRSRKSVRAFTDQSVSRETVEKILNISQRAPSGTNTQPWHTHVCTGLIRDAIAKDASALFEQGKSQKYEDFDYYPKAWNDVHRDRRRGIGWGLYGLLGIKKGDRTRSMQQAKRNFSFFDAPIALFFTTDSYLGKGSWLDTGIYVQTVMLAARAEGLHTCPQAIWISIQEPVRRHLNIPNDQVLVTGMAMGYQDTTAIENTLVSEREDVANVVAFSGFE
jgi:nitroreductase